MNVNDPYQQFEHMFSAITQSPQSTLNIRDSIYKLGLQLVFGGGGDGGTQNMNVQNDILSKLILLFPNDPLQRQPSRMRYEHAPFGAGLPL